MAQVKFSTPFLLCYARISIVCCIIFNASFVIAAQDKSKLNTQHTVLIFGDSLSAGYGISLQESWVSIINQRLAQQNFATKAPQWRIINLSISGETTAGGRIRLPSALQKHKPNVVVLALGANDGLRGLSLAAMQNNLQEMVSQAKQAGAQVLMVGMKLPENFGMQQQGAFVSAFAHVAKANKIPLLPFLLEPIAFDRNAFQEDGLHPTALAQKKIADHVWEKLYPVLYPNPNAPK